MEFKISEKSEANLRRMLQEEEEEKQLHLKEQEENERMFQEKYGFKSEEELIDWVLSGKIAIQRYDSIERIRRCGDLIEIRTMHFSECDIPLGYSTDTKTIEEFKDWRHELDKIRINGNNVEISWIKLLQEGD